MPSFEMGGSGQGGVCEASQTTGHRKIHGVTEKAYPIQSSAGGRFSGLIHRGDSRRCCSSSAVYRAAMATGRLRTEAVLEPGRCFFFFFFFLKIFL